MFTAVFSAYFEHAKQTNKLIPVTFQEKWESIKNTDGI